MMLPRYYNFFFFLQANTYNVEIQDDFPNQLRPDAIKLKFLSNDRPHEDLDMFGPSTSSMK